MTRQRWIAAGLAVVIVGGGVAAAIVASSDSTGATTAAPRRTTSLQPVALRTLATTQDVSGTIGYGTATTVRVSASSSTASSSSTGAATGAASNAAASTSTASSGSGTITALPAVGTAVSPGGSFAEVDGAPSAFLMIGTRPAWRTFTSGMSDGPDVQQLESTLASLGYGKYFTTDDTFTSGTTSAINAFESDRGITETGSLTTAQVVFLPAAVRVASQVAKVGATASGDILTTTGTTPLIHVDLAANLVASAHAGDVVKIDLPDSSTVDGTIIGFGSATSSTSTATGQGSQAATTTTVGVDIVVTGSDIAGFDGASVVVHLVTAKAEKALSVPVKSLLALAEGGFAVERVRGAAHQLVKVTPGTFAGGFVQVTGDVKVGDRVVTP